MTGDRTPAERRLADALHDTVDHLEPTGGLASVRARLEEATVTRSRPRPALLALAGAAAVAVVVGGVALATQDSGRPSSDAPPVATSPDKSPDESTDESTDGATDSPGVVVGAKAVPVYYLGDTPNGPRLFREFHRLGVAPGDEVGIAVMEAVMTTPDDPDYRTGWPAGTGMDGVTGPSPEDDVVTIALSAPTVGSLHDRPTGMSRAEAEMAVQQLVYTAQAALQERVPVRITLDGQLTDQVLGVPASEPLTNADEASTTASVWVISPQEGDTVRAGDVTVSGRGAFFEATVAWQLLQDGKVVDRGAGMAQECCTLSPYTFTIPDVEPGTYTIRVYDEDMSGGAEGNGEAEDTKTVTVE